ncbi:hypothetical protein BRCH_03226c [Candidatus Burkholderia brachyanthoides]|nr:hypothetical protein BRCH_03226c [Candidatus Burkholderia brachyanthoides]
MFDHLKRRALIASVSALASIVSLTGSPAHADVTLSADAGRPKLGVQVKIETFTAADAAAIVRTGFAFVRLGVWINSLTEAAYEQRVAAGGLCDSEKRRSARPIGDALDDNPQDR